MMINFEFKISTSCVLFRLFINSDEKIHRGA